MLDFDASGNQLPYLRGGVPHGQVIVRDLTTGKERSLDPGAGNLWRASLDAGGAIDSVVAQLYRHRCYRWPYLPARNGAAAARTAATGGLDAVLGSASR